MNTTLWTVGHSTRTADEFVSVLRVHAIESLVDVRRFPGSRRLPQFNEDALAAALGAHGIGYRSLRSLGGRRRPQADSINTGWRHEAFRGYADHLATREFQEGLHELLRIARERRTTLMCAEMLWWQCHRRLIADVLLSLGHPVLHIRGEQPPEPHQIREPARIVNGVLSYAADQTELFRNQ